MHRAPSPGLCSPLPPSPSSERKEGLGFSHGLTAVTGSVSLNYRDTMCINRVIASNPLGRRPGTPCGPEPILQYLWFVGSLPYFNSLSIWPSG